MISVTFVHDQIWLKKFIARPARSIGWMVIDLKPDQKWEVAHDRVMAQDLLSRSERKAGNLKKALRDWDAGHTGDNATQEWL